MDRQTGKSQPSRWPEGTLESVSECPVCGTADRDELHGELEDQASLAAPGRWTLYGCSGCGSAYLDPRPTPESIGRAYYSDYYTHGEAFRQAEPDSRGTQVKRALRNGYLNGHFGYSFRPASRLGLLYMRLLPQRRAREDQSIRHLRRRPGVPSLLDVGCGNGAFLVQMKGTGWSVRGIDPDPEAVARARAAGVPADEGLLTESSYREDVFDAITLSHVVEHAHEPVDLLRNCHRILRPGGVLWLATPNLASRGHARFGRHWRGLDPPRHLVLFTPKSLQRALERTGFELLAQPPACAAGWSFQASAAVAEKLATIDPPPPSRRLRWSARLADLRTLLRPDLGEEIVLLARRPKPG